MPEQSNPKHRADVPAPSRPRAVSCVGYAELDVTTNFSFLRGAAHPEELVCQAAELGHGAIAVTDLNSVAGIVRAHQAAKKVGIKLCVGSRLRFTNAPDVLVWAENRAGYANLCRMLTAGKRRAEKGNCNLQLEDLLATTDGLLAAAVLQQIDTVGADEKYHDFETTAAQLKDAFNDRISLAVSCSYGPTDSLMLRRIEQARDFFGVPLLATNQVHYHRQHRRQLQDVLTCVRHGCTIQAAGFRLFSNGERFLKPPELMQHLFCDHPEALKRTVDVSDRCTFSLDELRYEYPDEIVPSSKTMSDYLAELAWAGARERYPQGVTETVSRQIRRELILIQQLKIEAYFLTVYDIVRFARSRGILCQGRGSAANSAVCFCLGVTSVDPAQIDVLFERFVSAARDEPPDIDIDFEHERREEVIQYIYEKYGRDRAGMTAEIISYRGRSAVRDVGKALGLGMDAVDHIAKRLDWWHSGKLASEQIADAGLDPQDYTVRMLVGLTGELLGFPRHLSQHVGGLVVTRGPLCELVPIENASMPNRTVIEWDKDDIDALGILKVDVLALGMLTAIAKAMKLIDKTRPDEPPLELHTIPAEDPGVYEMISNADTVGVFQIESRAQMSMLPRLRPKEFYDLVIEVAIVRPGPIQGDMVHPYLRRRQGLEKVEYPKEQLRKVLGKTLGVPLFQEQAMRIAIECAGFLPEEADRLRRAVTGFRRYGDIETFGQKFVEGMVERGYERMFAERCFAQLRGFATYGFPESHAASFARLVYASAWIKRYHPAAFCCGLLNSQPMGFYAPAQLVRDAQEHGAEIYPVDVNCSDWDCTLEDLLAVPTGEPGKQNWGRNGPAVRLGFRMIKGFSIAHARRIIQHRSELGSFESIDHFHRATALPVTVIKMLSEADAFGSLPKTRRLALWEILALPDDRSPLSLETNQIASAPDLPLMSTGQEIRADYGAIGLSLKGHPVALVREELTLQKIISAAEVRLRRHGSWVKVAGLVLIRQRPATAKGIVFETLEDETGIVNLIIRPEVFERCLSAARHAAFLLAEGNIERHYDVQHIMAVRLTDLSESFAGYQFRSRDFR